jgi:hypothetical protein
LLRSRNPTFIQLERHRLCAKPDVFGKVAGSFTADLGPAAPTVCSVQRGGSKLISVVLANIDRQVFLDLAIGIEDFARDFHARVIINLPKRLNHVVAAQRERGDAI